MERRRDHTLRVSIVLVLLAAAYLGWLLLQGVGTVPSKVQGALGVLLGLFICSQPVARMMNALLFGDRPWLRWGSRRSVAWWLSLNLAVLVVGWIVIVVGTTRFVVPTG